VIDESSLSLVRPETAAAYAAALSPEDIAPLVERLASAEDRIRYPAFLLLRERSAVAADVLPFWDTFTGKLTSANSYQRSIGATLLAANARHDAQGRMRAALPNYLALLCDEKPVTVRQCAQSLREILAAQPALSGEIAAALMRVDLSAVRETMRKPILTDILEALMLVRGISPSAEVEAYLFAALGGGILDERAKKQFRARLQAQI